MSDVERKPRDKRAVQGFNSEFKLVGKLPPQARDLEESVLGAIMLESAAIDDVADILKPDVFYVEAHNKIYSAIRSLQAKSSPIDILTVTAELRQLGFLEMVGGAYYITELTNRVASAANIEVHARILLQKFIQREMIRLSTDTIAACYEDTADIFDVLTEYERRKDDFMGAVTTRKEVSNADLITETIAHMKATRNSEGITGVPSGFTDLDRITGGWQKSDLIIIAARPGMGKTSFVLSLADNAAIDFNRPVAFFSLEQSNVQLMQKQLSIETDIAFEKIKKNRLDSEDWSRIEWFQESLSMAPMQWDDTPAMHILEFRAKCRRLKAKYDIQLFIIDYLQLMHGNDDKNRNGNREQEIGKISRALKAVAKELETPVIALSQLSRKVEDRPGNGKRPMLSDLRESGSIEQDADIVIFLYRPEYYGIEFDEANNSTDGLAEVIIAKHRGGETSDICLKFNKRTTAFENDEPFAPTQNAGNWVTTEIPADKYKLAPNTEFDKPNNFIIRPNHLANDQSDDIPF